MKEFPYSKQFIDKRDIFEVIKTLKSKFLTQGPLVERFEKKICNFVGSKYAVAVSSCSAGLHLACLAANKKMDGSIVTSPITFISTASAILHVKKKLIFCDINNEDINISTSEIQKVLNKNKSVEGIIPVHFAGYPCDMANINKLCKKNDVYIIEDAAHAFGSKYLCGSMVGSCKYSLMTVFSFHPVKTITTGEGGVITTNNKFIYEKLKNLRSHGVLKSNNKKFYKLKPWIYEMKSLGFNYRLTDIQCSLGMSQLKKINKFLKSRKKIVFNYVKLLKNNSFCKLAQSKNIKISSNHLFVINIDFKKMKKKRGDLMNFLKKKKIFTQVHYIPLPMQPYFKKMGYKISNYPNSLNYYKQALSLPVFYGLKLSNQKTIINAIKNFFDK